MRHNDAVGLLGRCPCPCGILPRNQAAQAACWCDQRKNVAPVSEEETLEAKRAVERAGGSWEAPRISHNDAVGQFGACDCPCHRGSGPCRCREATEPGLQAALRRAAERDLGRRLRSGRARPDEYLRHAPHMLPGYRGPST